MNMDFKLDGAAAIQSSLNKAVVLLSPANMTKLMYGVGVTIQTDTKANFKNDTTYDGERMPPLTAQTWKAKNLGWGSYKKARRNPAKLYVIGTLQKILIEAKSTMVTVYSAAGYALALNDRKKHPFHFMGFGKKLLAKIDETIKKKTWELMFK